MKNKVNGITLLKMIKDKKLKNNTKINVLFDDDLIYDLVSELRYQDNELIWEPNTFRVAMLYDDSYLFEIIEDNPKKIETLDNRYYDPINGCYCGKKVLGEDMLVDKINELVDRLNYLLEKSD